jgi:cell division septal protein FtsQ
MESILKEKLEERRKKAQRRRKIRFFITVISLALFALTIILITI